MNWCSSHREDPRRCMTGVVLSFLQEMLVRRLSPSTLKVYVAAIGAHNYAVGGRSLLLKAAVAGMIGRSTEDSVSNAILSPSSESSV